MKNLLSTVTAIALSLSLTGGVLASDLPEDSYKPPANYITPPVWHKTPRVKDVPYSDNVPVVRRPVPYEGYPSYGVGAVGGYGIPTFPQTWNRYLTYPFFRFNGQHGGRFGRFYGRSLPINYLPYLFYQPQPYQPYQPQYEAPLK